MIYNSEHKVLICIACECAMTPGKGIERHFQRHHKDVSLEIRKAIVAYSKTLELALPLNVNSGIREVIPRIKGVSVHKGWCCVALNEENEVCRMASTSEEWVRKHANSKHNWTKDREQVWRSCWVQTLYPGSFRHIFEVSAEEPNDLGDDVTGHSQMEITEGTKPCK